MSLHMLTTNRNRQVGTMLWLENVHLEVNVHIEAFSFR